MVGQSEVYRPLADGKIVCTSPSPYRQYRLAVTTTRGKTGLGRACPKRPSTLPVRGHAIGRWPRFESWQVALSTRQSLAHLDGCYEPVEGFVVQVCDEPEGFGTFQNPLTDAVGYPLRNQEKFVHVGLTTAVAKEIVAEAKKKKKPRRQKAVPTAELGLRLAKVLERYREKWKADDLGDLARQLREFADALEKPEKGTKKKAKD
jgi:hypothetical protein